MITPYPRVSYMSDDYEPGTRNVHLLHHMATRHAAKLANEKINWPFPAAPIPADRTPALRAPDAEEAPW